MTLLESDYNVMIVGHSYGGSIAARIATVLNNHPKAANVHIATMGSIYNIKKEEANNIDLVQYMFVKDVALKCANLKSIKFATAQTKYQYDPVSNITWLPQPINTDKRWDIHNSYNNLCNEVIYSKNIHSIKN